MGKSRYKQGMGLFMPRSRRPRKFDYEPRFYDPEKEDKLRRRMHVRRGAASKRRNPTKLLYFAALLFMVMFIIYAI